MSAQDPMQNFVFRGLLLHSTFEDFGGALGAKIELAGDEPGRPADTISLDDFSTPIRTQALKMGALYQAFFCFENAVREFVADRLHESLGDDWWQKGTTTSTREKVEKRKQKEQENRWHSPRGDSEIAYADFGDLSYIITNNWALFEDVFPDQDWIRTRLADLEMSRNVIAHNGVLNGREITRITLYLKDWVMQVG